jgi:hypothetical protein
MLKCPHLHLSTSRCISYAHLHFHRANLVSSPLPCAPQSPRIKVLILATIVSLFNVVLFYCYFFVEYPFRNCSFHLLLSFFNSDATLPTTSSDRYSPHQSCTLRQPVWTLQSHPKPHTNICNIHTTIHLPCRSSVSTAHLRHAAPLASHMRALPLANQS